MEMEKQKKNTLQEDISHCSVPLSGVQVCLHPRTVDLYGDFSLEVRWIGRDRWEVLGHFCETTRDKQRTLANPGTYVIAVTSFKLLRWEAWSNEASSLRANSAFKCKWSQIIKIYIFVFICNILKATCKYAVNNVFEEIFRSKSKHQTPTLHFRDSYGLITQFRFDLPCSRLYIDPFQSGPLLHQSSLHVSTESSLITVLLI